MGNSRPFSYCLNDLFSDSGATTISPEPSFKQAAKAEAIATYAEAAIATAAPDRRYVELRYLHFLENIALESECKVSCFPAHLQAVR